jgi:hypothetical protein
VELDISIVASAKAQELPKVAEGEMPKGRTIEVFVAKKRDEKVIRALAKHLNQGAGGQRAARTKRKRTPK